MQFDVSRVTALMQELAVLEEKLTESDTLDGAQQAKIEKQIQKFHEDFADVSRQLNTAIENAADGDPNLPSLLNAVQEIANADQKLIQLSGRVEDLAEWLFVSDDGYSSTDSSVGDKSPKTSSKIPPLFNQIDELYSKIEDYKDFLLSKKALSESDRAKGKGKFNELLYEYRKLKGDFEKMPRHQQDVSRENLLSDADRSLRQIRSILIPPQKPSIGNVTTTSSSSSKTVSSKPSATLGATQGEVIEAPWFYDVKGRSLEGSASSEDLEHNPIWVSHRDKKLVDGDAYFQKTRMTADVLGDGCCGYYSYAAILLQNAKENPKANRELRSQIEALSMDWSKENIPFKTGSGKYAKTQMINVNELKTLVLGMLEAMEKDPNISVAEFLDRENGQILNLFFRAMIRKSYPEQLSSLGASSTLLTTLDEYLGDEGDLIYQYKEMENPILVTLNLLLGTDIGMMNFKDNRVTVMEKEGKEGNLIRVGGHFIYCLPRK